MVEMPEKQRTAISVMLKTEAVIHEPNKRPIQNELVIKYPTTHDNTSNMVPRQAKAPVIRKKI